MENIQAMEVLDIRADLLRKGLSLASFAGKHGLRPGTVEAVLRRHCGANATQKTIQGPMTMRVLQLIDEEINHANPNA